MQNKNMKQKITLYFKAGVIALGCLVSALYAGKMKTPMGDYSVDLTTPYENADQSSEDLTQIKDSVLGMEEPLQKQPLAVGGNSMIDIVDVGSSTPALEQEKALKAKKMIPQNKPAKEAKKQEEPKQEENVLNFTSATVMTKPVGGDIIKPFSMEQSIYFETLDQYRYHPGIMICAKDGDKVYACADAKIKEIGKTDKLGEYISLDLGNGYEAVYGQLKDILVKTDEFVKKDQQIASVNDTTIYYQKEGTHLYMELRKDGEPINPADFF